MGYKIFILDDKEENREAARTALCGEHELRFTKSFEEGKSVLNEFDPDLAIIDLNFSFVEGEQEEVLGYRFRDEVLMTREFPIPTVILTGGIKNHGKNSAEMYFFINMCQGEGKYLGMTEVKRDLAITSPGVTKKDFSAWEMAFNYPFKLLPALPLYLAVGREWREAMQVKAK